MSKFRFYVTDTMDGLVFGTNNKQDALDYATSEDYFVVDSETGKWMATDGERDVCVYGGQS